MTRQRTGTVRWGILGAGGIAHRFARSLAHVAGSELVAVSCRAPEKAAAFAEEFGVPAEHAFADVRGAGSGHEALLEDSTVDAIYLALPHGMHLAWAERALRAGKAVLCEKPAALSAGEARRIASVARTTGSLFMEAMKTRFEPAYREARRLVDAGAIGEVTGVETHLENGVAPDVLARSSYLLDPVQGGCLLDTGVYCAGWLDDLLPGAIEVGRVEMGRMGDVDARERAELTIGGRRALLSCAFDRAGSRQTVVTGTQGRVVVEATHRPEHLTVEVAGEPARAFDVPYEVDDFYPQIVHFAELVRSGAGESPVVPLSSTVRMAEILDAVRAAWS